MASLKTELEANIENWQFLTKTYLDERDEARQEVARLEKEVERLQTERDEAEQRLEDYYTKDAGKTNEINILTKENRRLRQALKGEGE
jgi:chromosome segregation ATPase